MGDLEQLSVEALLALVVSQQAQLASQEAHLAEQAGELVALASERVESSALVASLSDKLGAALVEIEALRRQVGRDSSSSSKPPSSDGLGAKAAKDVKKRAGRERAKAEQAAKSATAAGKGRVRGGQSGHEGKNLAPRAVPDETVVVEPTLCCGCGDRLDVATAGVGRIARTVQVIDTPPVVTTCTEYRIITRRCAGCAAATTAPAPAAVPAGVSGGTCYGPNLRAMAAFLGSSEVVGLERAVSIMAALVGAHVSTGFIWRCVQRLEEALVTAEFEDALKRALRASPVLGTDESPVRVAALDERGSNPHVFTVRTMHAATAVGTGSAPGDLIWCGAGANRRGATIDDFKVLPGYGGVLVRDDYGGYLHYEEDLQAVQQCVAHLRRYLADVSLHGAEQEGWCTQADRALTEAITLVRNARSAGMGVPDAALITKLSRLRWEYDAATAVGYSINLDRSWHKSTHPGLVLARRLAAKADQVWLFTHRFDVPATNNASEGAIRGVKVSQKISGAWRTLDTLATAMRVRSYLATTASHGIGAITAIRDALNANPWMPPLTT